jgi:hypothetical protein
LRRNLRNVHQCEGPANTVATNPKAISVKPNCFALVCISIASGVWAFSLTVWKNATVPDPKLAIVKEFRIQAKVVRSSANCVLNFGIPARLLASQRCRHTWLLIHPESTHKRFFPVQLGNQNHATASRYKVLFIDPITRQQDSSTGRAVSGPRGCIEPRRNIAGMRSKIRIEPHTTGAPSARVRSINPSPKLDILAILMGS